MISNVQNNKDSIQTLWEQHVEEQVQKDKLKCRTCKAYSTTVDNTIDEEIRCVCGRLARRHSFTGKAETEYQNAQKWRPKLAAVVDVTIYGQMKSGARVCSHLRTVLYKSMYLFFLSSFDVNHRSRVRWKRSFN